MKPCWLGWLCAVVPFSGCYSQPSEDGGASTTEGSDSTGSGVTPATGDTTGMGPGPGSATTTSDTTPDPTGDPPTGCQSNADCDNPSLPLCFDGTCGNCGDADDPDAACADADAALPICNGADCVQCTDGSHCEGMTPACEPSTGTCVACQYHEQCPGSACDIFDGECLPTDQVWWVALNCPAGNSGVGSEQSPFCDVVEALAQIPPGGAGTIFLTGFSFNESFVVDGGRTVALIAPGDHAAFSFFMATPQVIVTVGDGTIYLDNLDLQQGNPANLEGLPGSRIALDRCYLQNVANGNAWSLHFLS